MSTVQVQVQTSTETDLPVISSKISASSSLTFDELIISINKILGVDKALDTDDIDHKELMKLMNSYISSEDDWSKFAHHDKSRNYTRNGVEDFGIDGVNANLLLLVWNPGKGSVIHDHAKAHCVMKILKGTLTEELFEERHIEDGAEDSSETGERIKLFKTTPLPRETVAHITDDIGLHRISNKTDEIAVSLHLYTPPYAKKYGCHIFDENGAKHHVEMANLYSWKGEVLNAKGHSTC
ncbi:hypothetical protein CANARDRAFT_26293 [[Candida] arabinofermentans NRRL YB-2248]|uniref:Cysteine dioxygenase n=1 Tax=[Candida] arabinofermentans NRRL YB-2248 TaxID=983967 RepID=A0A1E4T8Q5_9ASCO|nr:hypothetical protein CANARDRAFT_26293 [[Candida] arabinofermentans NRRL YB-2248]